jgi:UDP-N-acetylmuramoyl-tripeptide--D-alanyl-D-alanine ligase
MTTPLWTAEALVAAARAKLDGTLSQTITGFSIDTRTVQAGDVFVALKDVRDGHDFVETAFKAGTAAALVSTAYVRQPADGPLFRVEDPLKALELVGMAARARLSPDARVIAVTGSAGKTTTKEMLRACLAHLGPVHASEKSYNNHWGVPLTLARMPAATKFGVFEIGMNHPGEIRPLSKMVRPHVAVVTSIAPAHLGHFSGLDEIAEAKAEIFEGLKRDGFAVIPRDCEQFGILAKGAAEALGERLDAVINNDSARIKSFGESEDAGNIISDMQLSPTSTKATLDRGRRDNFQFEVGLSGRHNTLNAAAGITAFLCATAGLEIPKSQGEAYAGLGGFLAALKSLNFDLAGRGKVTSAGGVTLLDESYNANPESMKAALATLALRPKGEGRRIAVIGDMLELGEQSVALHMGLASAIAAAEVDYVFACGPHMKHLFDSLPAGIRAAWAPTSKELIAPLLSAVKPGDVIMVKGSLGSRMAVIVDALNSRFRGEA